MMAIIRMMMMMVVVVVVDGGDDDGGVKGELHILVFVIPCQAG